MAKKPSKPISTINLEGNKGEPIKAGESLRGPMGRVEPLEGGLLNNPTFYPKPPKPQNPPPPKPVESSTVYPFGIKPNNLVAYPNDALVLDINNAIGNYLESDFRVRTYTKSDLQVTMDVESDLKSLGYISGKYNVLYKFHRNYLGSADAHKLEIQEISSDGLEIRLTPTRSDQYDNTAFFDFFGTGFWQVPKSQTLTNLFLLKQTELGTQVYRIFDYVQDKFTFNQFPFSIVVKLASPVPTTVTLGDQIWIAQQVSDPIGDTITLVPPKSARKETRISGPNWDVLSKLQTTVTTPYKDWDDILTSNRPTTEGIINQLLSSSFVEGIKLNVDYRSFENHITFGSAVERLENFKYKISLVESYDSRIADLTTNLNALPSSSVSSSQAFQTNVINARTKKAALIGSFDSYEKYLYYQSASYESSSYGEFYPSTWPKQNSTKPYINYSVTSSQVESWYEGIAQSASLFDDNNDKALYKLIPSHILEDISNDEYVLFTHMIGHYFDILTLYVKQITLPTDRQQSIYEGFSRDLIFNVAQTLGLDFDNGNSLDELWSYTLGTNATGSAQSQWDATSDDRTKEIWKRIINNLPFLLKTKGTERSIRALINCYGIPQTILRIREYGGAEPDFDSKTDLQYERFNYALNVGYNGLDSASYALYGYGTYGTGSYGDDDPSELIRVPWTALSENGLMPMSTQLRFRMAKNQTKEQRIMEVPDQWLVKAHTSGSDEYIGFYLSGSAGWATASVSSSIYDNAFWSLTLLRENKTDTSSDNQTYTLVAKRVNYDKVVYTHTASLFIDGNTSSSYNDSYITPGYLWIPGSGSFTFANSASMTILTGSVQEFRYWSETLQDAILDNHALAPTSFQGNTDEVMTGSTSSYYDLAFRLCLGSDNRRINYVDTSSFPSQHPNQFNVKFDDGSDKNALFLRSLPPVYVPIVERHSLEWPDLGGNRSVGNKIIIESTFTAGSNTIGGNRQLYRDNSVQRSLSDNQPPDSPRLGIYFSPQNEINQDIAEHFGGISIDDYIGNPSHLALDEYPDLQELKWEWSRKFIFGRNNAQNYIRLIRYFDSSLFQLIKKFVPYRANTQVGLVIEPTIIERAKVKSTIPTKEELQYDTTIDVGPDTLWTPGGFVQDGDGEPFRDQPYWANNGYVKEGTIGGDESDYITLSGEQHRVAEYNDIIHYPTYDFQAPREGIDVAPDFDEVEIDLVVIDGTEIEAAPTFNESFANQFNNFGVANNPSTSGSLFTSLDMGISQYGRDTRVLGSQYVFMTWERYGTGSSVSAPYMITSSRYDYHEALNPTILDSRFSEVSNQGGTNYDIDVYGGRAFTGSLAFTQSVILSSSLGLQTSLWTSQYGLHITSSFTGSIASPATATLTASLNTNYQWRIDPTNGLNFYNSSGVTQNLIIGTAEIDAFFFSRDNPYSTEYLYEVDVVLQDTGGTLTNIVELYFGGLDSNIVESISGITTTPTAYTFITRAEGPRLGIRILNGTVPANGYTSIKSLRVQALNYRAQVQDFHLRDSYGMRNARYDGCKMTSADYNIDSPDTSDGGPVIELTVGTGKELAAKPTNRGNFEIR